MDSLDPSITLARYLELFWLPVLKERVEPNTVTSYETTARLHIPDGLKCMPMIEIRRAHLKRVLIDGSGDGKLSRPMMARVANVLRSIFTAALDDEVIQSNPAIGIGPALGLRGFYVEKIRAMDGEQLALFLAIAKQREPRHYPELAVLAYTGIRIGELRGLQVGDVDLQRKTLQVNRQVLESGVVVGPKGRRGRRKIRTVDLADDLCALLDVFISARREFELRMGTRSPWLLYPDFSATPTVGEVSTVTHRLRRAMKRILAFGNLPAGFTPHALRHTYATLLLQRGEELAYVSRQLGDTLAMAFELYGRHARVPSRAGGPNLIGRDSGNILRKP